MKKDRKNKVLLHGYGHYGVSLDVTFNISYLSAIENNWVLAFAHVRGGNEKGFQWHQAAILKDKSVASGDFINCAEFLVSKGYTHPSLMCAYGSSAGATLVSSAINQRPELFKACVLNSPFLDVLSSLLDENLPLTVSDHDEFGNPLESVENYDTINSLCPYENIGK